MFNGDVQSEEVDGEAQKDEQEHVGTQSGVSCWVDEIVLRVIIRTPDDAGGVYHRDIEKWSLRAVHGCSLLGSALQWFFWLERRVTEGDLVTEEPRPGF